jgi:hypothetical protein
MYSAAQRLRGGDAGSKRLLNFAMPGADQNVTTSKRARGPGPQENHVGRANPDTTQGTISATAVMKPPPKADDALTDHDKLLAPPSNNPLADTPSRGDWAMTSPLVDDPLSSGLLTYGNAVPIFTNMAGVPKGTKMGFAGLITNPGQAKDVSDGSRDNVGAMYVAGATTGRNTGPNYIPPMSLVYASPYPYVVRDPRTGKKSPGYVDPGWIPSQIDKYLVATIALRDEDIPAYFQYIENKLSKKAQDPNCIERAISTLEELQIDEHLPAHKYAQCYLYKARLDFLLKHHLSTTDVVPPPALVEHIQRACEKLNKYWAENTERQKAITDAMGGPKWETKRAPFVHWKGGALDHAFIKLVYELQEAFHEVLKAEFIEQCNTIRNFAIGKSRYGCPERGQLDIVMGYNVR